MKHSTFFTFVFPSLLAMTLLIVLPVISVVVQSLYAQHEQVIETVQNCGPFGCSDEVTVNQEATQAIREAEPLGRFVGFDNYFNRGHLAVTEMGEAWRTSTGWGDWWNKVMNLPFYSAIVFTLTFTFVVTPLTIGLGFAIAVAVNSASRAVRGPLIFVSLLPFIITPLVGSLVLFWMVDARGILGHAIQWLAGNPDLSVKASTPLMWIMLMVYGVWHSAPFAFVVFYAGLQTVNQDTNEAAMIDGANRWQRVRYVTIPHIMPLVTFVALIQLMDNFRVFEPLISFSAEAHAQSLSTYIYYDLGGETRLLNSAAATSLLTVICVGILLSPVLVRTWRDFKRA
ncbi:sugar ABC transporter permease [Octadecabacter sp. G9-8]|uniref:Sugar ABC transporter permease n=1 Tax=Octadecabacter dasysiphoniae TaxID=2909341 RepID=A0ABS9CYB9_9RHOB|nr:sugar ABC transporter permease [Octadecabacter dasysiphoniae]MCF2871901.1 sugar ABC transporter permease [Octadecabacter dasysiphoniae]